MLLIILLLAVGVWAQPRTIDITNISAGNGVTISGNDITIAAAASGSTITGTATDKRLIISAGVGVIFRNLDITSNLSNAVSINSGSMVTITLQGSNSLVGGIGSAALRVPAGANLTINGPGSLRAQGGQWRSLIGADAGAGIGGGNIENTGSSVNGNRGEGCGTVIINGGTIVARGGGGGESGTNTVGSRCSYAAGIGGSGGATTTNTSASPTNANGACNLTINGGNVTATGGNASNGIGPGTYFATCNVSGSGAAATATPSGTQYFGSNGSTRINGGSVNAAIRGTVYNGANSNISAVTQRVFSVGLNNVDEVSDRPVNDCKFASIKCGQTESPNATLANSIYGIRDVKTDFDGRVYFWLPSSYASGSSDYIDLNIDGKNKTYNWSGNVTNGANFQGPLPSIEVPATVPNSLVGEVILGVPVEGPYKTGFRASATQNVAAVGHEVTLNLGKYIPNDAGAEAAHEVRWHRADISCIDSRGYFDGSRSGCAKSSPFDANLFVTRGTVITHTPTKDDYNKVIWAEVTVKSNNNFASWEKVLYPAVKVGVVVKAVPNISPSLLGNPINYSQVATTITQVGSPRADSLFLPDLPLPISATVSVANVPSGLNLNYSWETERGSFVVSKGYSISYKLPCLSERDGCSEVEGDIILRVEIEDGSSSELESIKICKLADNATSEVLNSPSCTSADSVMVLRVVNRNNEDTIKAIYDYNASLNGLYIVNNNGTLRNMRSSDVIPKRGKIVLGFDRAVRESDNKEVSLKTGSKVAVVDSRTDGSSLVYESVYTYGLSGLGGNLDSGAVYTLTARGFVNRNGISISPFTGELKVEQKASIVPIGYGQHLFIVGEQVTGSFTYQANNGGNATAINYFWDIRDGANGGNNPPSDDVAFSSTGSVTPNQTEAMSASSAALIPDNFGKWIRLVVRPTGASTVDGTNIGYAVNFPWKRIGVLLVPAEDSKNPKEFTNVSFKGCDVENPDLDIMGCQASGYIAYDKIQPIRLGVNVNDIENGDGTFTFNKVKDWEDDISAKNNCATADGPFHCGQYATYTVKTVPASGRITITPIVGEISPPSVASIKLKDVEENDVELKTTGEGFGVKILNNQLVIVFDDDILPGFGAIRLIKGDAAKNLYDLAICDARTCTVDLNLETGFTGNRFNANFRIIVSGFKNSAGDQMQTETFNFTTAQGPTVAPTLSTTGIPAGTYAVGHAINVSSIAYTPNAGDATEGIHTCYWYREGTATAVRSGCSYTPTLNDFNKNITLEIIPKDADNREGTAYRSSPMLVGVLLKAGTVTKNSAIGNPSILIGSADATESIDGIVVYGTTTVRLGDMAPTDKFIAWNSAAGTFTNAASSVSNFNPGTTPSSDIAINATIDDGELPTIFGSRNSNNELELIISKPVDIVPGVGIRIVQEDGAGAGNIWATTVAGTLGDGGKELKIPLENFMMYGTPFDVSSANRFRVEIDAGAFEDSRGNLTLANAHLCTFASTSYYAIQPSKRSFVATATYGDYDVNAFASDEFKVNITNKSSTPISLKASLADGTNFVVLNDDIFADVGVDADVDITLGIVSESLPAGEYNGVLIIEENATPSRVREEVALTFIVNRKVLEITTGVTIPAVPSRAYDRTTTVPPIYWGSWDWSGAVLGHNTDTVNVEINNGDFGDNTVGNDKPISASYEITGSLKTNYTFAGGASPYVQPVLTMPINGLKADITQREITVEFLNANMGTKVYDGLNSLSGSDINHDNYRLKAGGDDGVISGDAVSLNKAETEFTFRNANVGEGKEIFRASFALANNATAANYKLVAPDFTNVTGTITIASLADLSSDNETYDNNCTVSASAIYGDEIRLAGFWENPPEGSCDVTKHEMTLAGRWRVCTGAEGEPAVCGASRVPARPRVTTIAQEPVWAYFDVAGGNYKKDLAVLIDLEVKPKTISLSADLTGAGNLRYGIKTYDGNTILTGVKALDQNSANNPAIIEGDEIRAEDVVVEAAFIDANAGNNKPINITWTSNSTDLSKKYAFAQTNATGTISPRKLRITGVKINDKDYDGTRTATAQSIGFGDLEREESKECELDDYNCVPSGLVDGDSSPIGGSTLTVSGASFVTPYVNCEWDANYNCTEKPVEVIFTSATGLSSASGNYTLEIAPSQGIIRQVAITESGKTFQNRATYGDKLGDVYILTTQAVKDTAPSIYFPRQVKGISSEDVQGIWKWENENDYVGHSTNDNCRGKEDDDYDNGIEHNLIFEPMNDNYKVSKGLFKAKVCVVPRKLAVTAGTPTKVYDGKTDIEVPVEIGNLVEGDDVRLSVKGIIANPNAGANKAVSIASVNWGNGVSETIKKDYILPAKSDIMPTFITGTIEKASCLNPPPKPEARPAEFAYDLEKYPKLANIELSGGWHWVRADTDIADPHNETENSEDFPYIIRPYSAEFTPIGADASNYNPCMENVSLRIRKRNTNNAVKSAAMASACGSASGDLTVEAEDNYATIWYHNNTGIDTGLELGRTNKWTFPVTNMAYGHNEVHYEIQAQAYGAEYRAYEKYDHVRYLPFDKVTRWIRDKSLAASLDSSSISEAEFFGKYEFDLARTNWYNGEEHLGTGYFFDVLPGHGDYNVELFTTTGEIFYSCKLSGAYPEYFPGNTVPVMPAQPSLAASSFGSKLVAGGTTLTLNTPHGGTVKIYTLRGELVSSMKAKESHTVVKLPAAKGMYIVKLEAK